MKKTKPQSNIDTKSSPSTRKTSKNRRSANPLNALEKKYTLKIRVDEIDYDYIHKLNQEEKLWLAKFTAEELHCSVNKDGRKNKFNKNKADIKAKFDRNNQRNRCTWSNEKAKGMGQYLEDHKKTLLSNNPEEYLAVKMDLERDNWVDKEGNVLVTENELIKQYKSEEKKLNAAKKVK